MQGLKGRPLLVRCWTGGDKWKASPPVPDQYINMPSIRHFGQAPAIKSGGAVGSIQHIAESGSSKLVDVRKAMLTFISANCRQSAGIAFEVCCPGRTRIKTNGLLNFKPLMDMLSIYSRLSATISISLSKSMGLGIKSSARVLLPSIWV